MNDVYNERHIGLIFKPIFLSINPSLSTHSIRNYLSDIRHFMGWYANWSKTSGAPATLATMFSQKTIEQYEMSMKKTAISHATMRRRLGTVRLVENNLIQRGIIEKTAHVQDSSFISENDKKPTSTVDYTPSQADMLSTESSKGAEKTKSNELFTPFKTNAHSGHFKDLNKKNIKWKNVFGLMGLAFIVSIVGFSFLDKAPLFSKGAYQARSLAANIQSNSLTARPILFQGAIKDSLGNPLLQAKKFQFKIYSREAGGTPLYDSGICKLQPTVEGKIRAYIGAGSTHPSTISTCGSPIPQSLITSNTPLYLGVTIGADEEMTPRQPLANTELSTNALKVEGYGIGTGANAIPYIQNDGTITLSDPSSKILATSTEGTFTIGGSSAILLSSGFLKDIEFEATQSGNIRFKTSSNNHDQMVIAKNGNIGIRTSTPNVFELEISGSVGPSIRGTYDLGSKSRSWDTLYTNKVCFASEEYCISKTSLNGLSIETADVAEIYPTEQTSSIGDVMAIGTSLITTTTGEQIRKLIKATDQDNQHLIGVIANNTDRRIVVGHNVVQEDNPQAIALKGRIPVKIDPNSPAIAAGDYITTSSLAGRATKATKSGIMIGRALNEWKPNTGQETVMTYIDTSYAAIDSSPWKNLAKEIQTLDLFPRSVTTQKIISPIIETDQLQAKTITSSKIQTDQLQAQSATISGVLKADTVEAKNITALVDKIQQAVEKTSSLEVTTQKQASETVDTNARMNEIQASLNKLTSSPSSIPTNNIVSDGTAAQTLLANLTVTEAASVFDLNVGGTIRSLSDQLHITALAGISFMNNAVQLTQDGTIVTKGSIVASKGIFTNSLSPLDTTTDLTVELGDHQAMVIQQKQSNSPSATIASDGTAAFAALGLAGEASPSAVLSAQQNLAERGIYTPGIDAQAASVGIGTVPEGEQEVAIFSKKLTPGAKVFLTPLTKTASSPTVTITQPCEDSPSQIETQCNPYFLVETTGPTSSPVSFNWLIIQTQSP